MRTRKIRFCPKPTCERQTFRQAANAKKLAGMEAKLLNKQQKPKKREAVKEVEDENKDELDYDYSMHLQQNIDSILNCREVVHKSSRATSSPTYSFPAV